MTDKIDPKGSNPGGEGANFVPDKVFKLRPFRPDAYGEADIETKARVDIANS